MASLYRTVIFLARTLASTKPSENSMISQMSSRSGTTMTMGRNSALRLSGSSRRPAYPGFMVTKTPIFMSSLTSRPSKWIVLCPRTMASWICLICCETTERTSGSIRLNSSKHPHDPVWTSPEKIRPIAR